MEIKREGNKVTITYMVSDKPVVSKTEAQAATKAGREPIAKSLFTSGGFIPDGKGAKHSVNVIAAS